MEEEIVEVINIKTDASINTVKDLKKYISELRDDLVKLNKGTEEYDKTLEALISSEKKLTEVMSAGKNEIKAAAGSYNALQQEMTALRKVWKETTDEATRNQIGQRIAEINTQLKDMDASIGNFQRNVGNYKSALDALNKTYSNQREELSALKKALDQLDPSTKEYEQAFNRASEITHNLADRQEMLKYASADLGDQLSNIRGIATNMVAGFSAVNAAMGLFGEESEDVQKAMLKVQQSIALVQGLEGLDGFIKRTQGLSTALKEWTKNTNAQTTATNAQTTAIKGETTAQNAQTVATTKTTVAQKGLNAAIKANPIGAIIAGITALVAAFKILTNLFDKFSSKSKKLTQDAKDAEQAFKDFDATISNLDRENRLERVRMELEGISSYDITLKEIAQTQEKLNLTQNEFAGLLLNIIEDINEYNSDATITTGTLKKMGLEQDNINDLMKTGMINIEESDKVLKKIANNDAFKSLFQDAVKYVEIIKTLNETITVLNYKAKEESLKSAKKTEEERKKLAEQAAKQRVEIEKKYQAQIQKNYATSIRETVNQYKEELTTMRDFLTARIKVETDPNTIKNIKDVLKQINSEIKRAQGEGENAIDIFNLENSVSSLQTNFDRIKKVFDSKLKDAIEKSGEESAKRINDQIIKLFEKTIQPDINKELDKIQNNTDLQTFELDYQIDFKDVDIQAKEIEKVKVQNQGLLDVLDAQLDHYKQIKKFVDENNLTPSDEYDTAKQKIIELELEIEKTKIKQQKELNEINTKYFNIALAQTQAETETLVKSVEDTFKQSSIKEGWDEMFRPISPEEEQKYLDDIYNVQLNGLTKVRDLWLQRANDETLTNEERVEAKRNLAQAEMDISDLILEHDVQVYEQRKEQVLMYVDIVKESVNQISSLFGSLADIYEENINAQVKANKMSEKEADLQFEKVKGLRIAEATINTIAGSIGAFMQASATYPAPYGQILGGITAAAVTAAGIAQIQKIAHSERSGSSNASAASVQAPQINEVAPTYITNLTGESDIDNLRNAMTDSLENANIRAYVVESDITDAQKNANKRNQETNF